jgi:hypothetical protein
MFLSNGAFARLNGTARLWGAPSGKGSICALRWQYILDIDAVIGKSGRMTVSAINFTDHNPPRASVGRKF